MVNGTRDRLGTPRGKRTRSGTCQHCKRDISITGRGLCRRCYDQPEIRAKYLPLKRGPKGPWKKEQMELVVAQRVLGAVDVVTGFAQLGRPLGILPDGY